MKWTDDKVELLKKCWDEGMAAADIATSLGVTKNSVLGKAHRLKLSIHSFAQSRGKKIKSGQPKQRKPVQPKIRTTKPAIKEPSLDQATWVPFMESDGFTCRSIMGRGTDGLVLFCPNSKVPEESYCPYHALIYYNGNSSR